MDNKNECLQPTEVEPKAHNKSNRDKYIKLLDSMQEGTHTYDVLNHLLRYGSITSIRAIYDYGDTRLSATIFCLKKLGVDIATHRKSKVNKLGRTIKYAVYELGE